MQKLIILKSGMKDPSTFELVYTKQLKNGKLEVKYRAINGFEALATETKILH